MNRLGLFIVFCLVLPAIAFAGPSNGTRFPAQGEIEVGYEYHVMFERELDRSFGTMKTVNYLCAFSIGMADWLVIDGKLGGGDTRIASSSVLPRLEFDTDFAGGYGFRIKAFEDEKSAFRLITGMQHVCVHPKDEDALGDEYDSILDDWQVSLLAAKDFGSLTPYVGVKLSDAELIYEINKHDRKRRFSKNHLGLIFGLDSFFLGDRMRFNAEARFFDETGFSTEIAYLF